MTDVYIITLLVIGFLVTSPGLAAAINLFFPKISEAAYLRVKLTPVKAFFIGVMFTAFMGVWVAIFVSMAGPFQAVGVGAGVIWLGVLTIGTSAMARLLGERLAGMIPNGTELGNILRGAVIYELAALMPLVGWLLFTPIMSQVAVGAALFGLVRWAPKMKAPPPVETTMNFNEITAAAD
jgi:hypothetical protein